MKRLILSSLLAVFACGSGCATAQECATREPLVRLALNDPEQAKAKANEVATDLEDAAKALRDGHLPDKSTHDGLQTAARVAKRLSKCLER